MPAIIFDMDDTLVSTAPLWRRAEERLLAHLGAKWSDDLARRYKGMNALDVAATVHRALQPPGVSKEECQQVMRTALLEEFATELPEAMPGAVECVQRMARESNNRVALASGSPIEAIESVVMQLKLLDSFAVIVSSESVHRGKPHPDVFLIAAEKLGANPSDCIVIEDSLIGAQAAKAAGMKCIAIPTTPQTTNQFHALAATVVRSLDEVTSETVAELAHQP
jgi:sugar-phosphatase